MMPKPPAGAEVVEMVDGRVFWSRDGWRTIYRIKPDDDRSRLVRNPRAADHVRFLAVSQSSWAGNAG